MRGYNCYEEIEIYRTTNRFRLEAGRDGHSGCRSVPQDGHLGGDVFQSETQVFRLRNCRTAAAQATRRRELAAQGAYENGVVLDFSRPGKPTDNAFIESFNGSFRDECLNVNWFLSLEDAWEKIQAFKEEYNHFRPHKCARKSNAG